MLKTGMWAAVWICALGSAFAAGRVDPPDWKRPFPAHRIVGNVYYVGGWDLAAFLIVTPKGDALINTGLAGSGEAIRHSMRELGFEMREVKWLLTTQAHYDHVEGMAEVQRMTGAQVWATEADARVLEDGGRSDYHFGAAYRFPPVKVDRRLKDGEVLDLGGVALTVHLHPGHTQGSASYSMVARDGGRDYRVLMANLGTINPGVKLVGNRKYPRIAQDYALTFQRQKKLACDVFLASHAGQYHMHEKYRPGMPYDRNRFVDPQGYRRAVAAAEAAFRRQLAAEESGK